MMISEGFVITIIITTTIIVIPTIILSTIITTTTFVIPTTILLIIPLVICSTPLRKSSGVPDSPCSVASDGSGSWIGIPRVMIVIMRMRMRMIMMSMMMMRGMMTRGTIVIHFCKGEKELD